MYYKSQISYHPPNIPHHAPKTPTPPQYSFPFDPELHTHKKQHAHHVHDIKTKENMYTHVIGYSVSNTNLRI